MKYKRVCKTPLEYSLKILPKFYQAKENPKEALIWYFGKSWDVLNQTSCILTKDWDDAVAWELHEVVEACEYKRMYPSEESPDWTSSEFQHKRKVPHEKATNVELQYLRDIGRLDLVKERIEEIKEKSKI
jgi:hypothetical protein